MTPEQRFHHRIYQAIAIAAVLALSVLGYFAVVEARHASTAATAEVRAGFAALNATTNTKLAELSANLDHRGDKLQATVDSVAIPLAGTLVETKGLVADIRQQLPVELAFANKQVLELKGPAQAVLNDVAHVSAAHLKDTVTDPVTGKVSGNHASWPAMATGLFRSSELLTGQAYKTAKTVEVIVAEQAPPTGAAVRKSADAIAGVAQDTKRLADVYTEKLLAPKTWWRKCVDWLKLAAILGSKFI